MYKEHVHKKKVANQLALLVALVIIPWVAVIVYVLTLAHPRYVSTSDVVVKQVSQADVGAASGLGALFGVNNTSTEDANYLTEYILSNDMVKMLDSKFKFREAYYVDGSDPIYEIEPDATQEELLEYFRDRVNIDLDEQSHVLTVTTEGFNPEYALELNKAILASSEAFVNAFRSKLPGSVGIR